MVGSGTSVEVANEMGIEAHGLDLHQGFNAVTMDILSTVGKEGDLVWSHPPYGSMIKYSGPGGMWGDEPHPGDLSHCASLEDFHEKMQRVLLNQRRATKDGGHYATLIGDMRRDGRYVSFQAEMIARMPSDELAAVLIKAQHNCVSDRKAYGRMTLPRIAHEYLIVWKKRGRSTLVLLSDMAKEQHRRLQGTWISIVQSVMTSLGGSARLDKIYQAVADSAPDRLKANSHWEARVRAILNSNPHMFTSAERGHWQMVGV